MQDLTDEQKKDVEDRKQKFVEEYSKLVEKYEIDFNQQPFFVPVAQGMWAISLVAEPTDKKYLSVPSPIQ